MICVWAKAVNYGAPSSYKNIFSRFYVRLVRSLVFGLSKAAYNTKLKATLSLLSRRNKLRRCKKPQLPTLLVTNGRPRRPLAQSQRRHIGSRRREPGCPAGPPGFMLHTSTSWSRLAQLLHHMEVMGPLITTVLSY